MRNSDACWIAFQGGKRIAFGAHADVALKLKALLDGDPQARILIFDASTSEQIDFDHRGTPEQMLRKLVRAQAREAPVMVTRESSKTPGPGRPRLGVVAREVTLLPRHWEWLSAQTGGASVALRKLVEQARRDNVPIDQIRQAQEASYRFMSAVAGDRAGFEEAARALFVGERSRFEAQLAPWPTDIRNHTLHLAAAALDGKRVEGSQHA